MTLLCHNLQGMITPGGLSNEACDAYDAVSCCWYQKMLFCKLVAVYHVCMNEQVVVGVSSRGVHMELLQEVNFRPKTTQAFRPLGLQRSGTCYCAQVLQKLKPGGRCLLPWADIAVSADAAQHSGQVGQLLFQAGYCDIEHAPLSSLIAGANGSQIGEGLPPPLIL